MVVVVVVVAKDLASFSFLLTTLSHPTPSRGARSLAGMKKGALQSRGTFLRQSWVENFGYRR